MNETAKHTLKLVGVGAAIGIGVTAAYFIGKKAGIRIPKSYYGVVPSGDVSFYTGVEKTFPAMVERQNDLLCITFDTLSEHKDAIADVAIKMSDGSSEPIIDFLAKSLNAIGLVPSALE